MKKNFFKAEFSFLSERDSASSRNNELFTKVSDTKPLACTDWIFAKLIDVLVEHTRPHLTWHYGKQRMKQPWSLTAFWETPQLWRTYFCLHLLQSVSKVNLCAQYQDYWKRTITKNWIQWKKIVSNAPEWEPWRPLIFTKRSSVLGWRTLSFIHHASSHSRFHQMLDFTQYQV